MIRELTIDGFRGFKHFKMQNLGRVNLLVGMNSSGKTSVLEAIEIGFSTDVLDGIWGATARRGERALYGEGNEGRAEVEIFHLFHGRQIDSGSHFVIGFHRDDGDLTFNASVVEADEQDDTAVRDGGTVLSSLQLRLQRDFPANAILEEETAPLSRNNAIPISYVGKYRWKRRSNLPPVSLVTSSSLSASEVVAAFERIVLTEFEDLAVEALRVVDPRIERLATASQYRTSTAHERGGIFAKLKDSNQRIPIASLGEGIWRILSLALAITTARGGILLVDDIDSGLHHSVMGSTWQMIFDAARKLDVQVFATTHSRDCYQSLAAISRGDIEQNSDVTIQRIEQGKEHPVEYLEGHIVAAAEHDIEVR